MNPELPTPIQPSLQRLAALGVACVLVFFLTMMVPFLVGLSAFPLVVATVYYKRSYTVGLVVLCAVVIMTVSGQFSSGVNLETLPLFPLFLVVVFIAFLVGEILRKQYDPAQALVVVGAFLALVVFVGGAFAIEHYRDELSQIFIAKVTEYKESIAGERSDLAKQLDFFIQSPGQFLNALPVAGFLSIFLAVWFNLFMILRGHANLKFINDYPYTLKSLLKFRLPNSIVYCLIAVLAIYVLPEKMVGTQIQTWAGGLIYVLGSFFFMQGFGVYIEYLNFAKIHGVIRFLFITMTLLFLKEALAIIGILDMWFNFRKFFKSKGEQ